MPRDETPPRRPEGSILDFPDFQRFTRGNYSAVRWIALAIVGLIALLSSIYTVQPKEVGVVLRLGTYAPPPRPAGLHFKLPFGIDQVQKVAVEEQIKEEFGFRTIAAGVRSEFARGPAAKKEADMLTGDLNTAVVEWVVQYRVSDPVRYLFRVRNVDQTFRDINEAVMRATVGDRTVDEVVTLGRHEIETLAKERLQELCDQYEIGLRVDQLVLQDVTPPDPVKPSFNAVNQAEQERARLINEAESRRNQIIPRAQGEASQTIQQAEGYALNRVNRAQGDAARFNSLFEEYRKAPEVTRTRLYLETMSRILPAVGRTVVVDADLEVILPLLNLQGSSPVAPAQPGGGN